MKYGHWLILGTLAVSMTAPLSGCGDNDNSEIFADCGNGVVNTGEECDDGNQRDDDACLTSCLNARCGDGFIYVGVEECDATNLAGESCTSLGEQNGTLSCSTSCNFDTSGCSGNPAPTSTPETGPTPTPTPAVSGDSPTPTPATSGDSPTPTPTSTPTGGPVCAAGEKVIVDLTTNIPVGGVELKLLYPDSVRIPGTGGESSVIASVTFPPGFLSVNDQDTNGDLVDDRVDCAWVSSGGTFTALATVEFECPAGNPRPTANAFTCTITSASDELGTSIDGVVCTASIQ